MQGPAKLFLVRVSALVIGVLGLSTVAVSAADSDLKLTYDKPASKWTEALPLGNGRIGAMVFGGTETEHIQINEGTLWGGRPNDYVNPEAAKNLVEVQRLIFAGKFEEARKLTESMMGRPKLLAPYQPFCDLHLRFPGHSPAKQYRRELRLEDAVSTVTYQIADVTFRREIFVSYPDQVLVIRLTADKPRKQSVAIQLDSPQPGTRVEVIGSNSIQLSGQIQPRQNPESTWTSSWNAPGMRFAARLTVVTEGGVVRRASDHIDVNDANSVTILFSNATSYRNYKDIGGDADGASAQHVQLASTRSYEELRRRHVEDFQRLFSRVHLRLGSGEVNDTTDERIRNFAKTDDPGLAALYYQFSRYLLISSSRSGGQPINLQGIWNEDLVPEWGSKWTTNINLEMNYWPAESGDLWETEEPLWSLIEDLRITGADTARFHYNSSGWVLHHNTDIWRATTPVDGSWGIWPLGGVWLANQMWDHYEFSQDLNFLRREAYPAMKGAAQFVLGTLVEAPPGTRFAGKLVTNPSVSPENQYLLDGKSAFLTYAPTMDIELISDLFENCLKATGVLSTDADLRVQIERAQKRLPPLQVGKRGQLQEWIEDYNEAEPEHRHTSHLYALYPGRGISLDATPELAAAARKTLELRGDAGTGWSKAWKVALWARLRDGDHAYRLLQSLISESTLPNLFDVCPPFQIDGNFGGAAAIAEMLLQSGRGEIMLLPSLPSAWSSGKVEGLRARGGVKVGIEWLQGELVSAWFRSDVPGKYRVRYQDKAVEVDLQPGKTIQLDSNLKQRPHNADSAHTS